MRILRNKHHRRTLNFFKIAFGVMPPYKLLIDGNFVMQAVKMQQGTIEVGVQRVLMAACYLHITECIMRELRGLGDKFAHVVAAASKSCLTVLNAQLAVGAPMFSAKASMPIAIAL